MDRRTFSLAALAGAAPASEDVRRAIQSRLDLLCRGLLEGDARKAASVFAADVRFMVSGAADLMGREAVERRYAARLAEDEYVQARIVAEEVVATGEWACERGVNDMIVRKRAEPKAPRRRTRGKYLTLWRRTARGEWEIVWDLPVAGAQPPETLPAA